MSAPVPIRDDLSWPEVCACCDQPATTRRPLPYSLREPAFKLIMGTGALIGLLVACWMMIKVRPGITHELPGPVAFLGLFLCAFAPVWVVASLTSRHSGTLQVPLCERCKDDDLSALVVQSKGEGRLAVDGISPALREALRAGSAG